MEILFATTELAPQVKVGGLADVSAALTKALRALGHSVTLLAPRYPQFERSGLLVARRLTPLSFTLGTQRYDVTLYDGRLPSQVELVLVDVPGLYDRGGVYGDETSDSAEHAVRFAVLSRTASELAEQRAAAGKPFDIVHCNDWPTALIPLYLAEQKKNCPELAHTHTVLTLHNVAHQGVFPKETLPSLGLGWDHFSVDSMEFYGAINVLKGGILAADALTTVSPTYARELLTSAGGEKLDGVLRSRASVLTGITNGIDTSVWSPSTDPSLPARYDAEDTLPKTRCRGALQKELGLPLDPSAPLVVNVGRLVAQKGTDLVAAALPRLLRATDAQYVIAGDGDSSLIAQLESAVAKSHGRAMFVRAAPEALVHRLFAAADLVLVPSRFEPCGLVQLYAQRYGALPVARATGGILDTVVDCDARLETGTGFLFDDPTVDALVGAVERALTARLLPTWQSLVRRVMRLDRGWERPARRYDQLYRPLRGGK
jgi:starch synthase